MRRLACVVAISLAIAASVVQPAGAGGGEDYRYRSVNASLGFRVRSEAGRVNADIYGYRSTVNGQDETSGGASVFISDRVTGLVVHCYAESDVGAAFEATRRGASLQATVDARCHTHSEPFRRGRGSFVLDASWLADGDSSSYSFSYSEEGYRCVERGTSQEATGAATMHVEAEKWDISIDVEVTDARGRIGHSSGSCRFR